MAAHRNPYPADTTACHLAEAERVGNLGCLHKLKGHMGLVAVPVAAEVFAGLRDSCCQMIFHSVVVDSLCYSDHTQAQQQQ